MDKILEWMSPTRWAILLVIVLVAVSSVLAYGEWRANSSREAEKNKWEAAVAKMQAAAAVKLGEETRKVLALERTLATIKAQQEADYELRRMDSHKASMALDRAADRNGGVFVDPNGRSCGDAAQSPGAGNPGRSEEPRAEAGGVLSVPLSNLLRGAMREADQFNDTYALCRGDSLKLRETLNRDGDGH